mmetsp:Transcript_4322/g.17713  ORF Transcript_4322/g.17713 Transcript_4322/m.17713 type:complete len:388 (+) Transcript_4322:1535-2698(+)
MLRRILRRSRSSFATLSCSSSALARSCSAILRALASSNRALLSARESPGSLRSIGTVGAASDGLTSNIGLNVEKGSGRALNSALALAAASSSSRRCASRLRSYSCSASPLRLNGWNCVTLISFGTKHCEDRRRMVAGTGLATTRRFKAAASSSSASRRSSTFRAYAPRLSVVRLNPKGWVSGLADQSALSGSWATREAPPPTTPPRASGAGAGALSNARLLVLSLGDSGAVGGMNPPRPCVSSSLLRFASRAARSSSSAAASAPRLRPSCLSQPPFLASPSLARRVATSLCSAAALARSAASPAPSSTARRTGLALNLGAAAIASSSSSSVVFDRVRTAFDLLSAGDLGLVGALSRKLSLSRFLPNVRATEDPDGEFSSRTRPCDAS